MEMNCCGAQLAVRVIAVSDAKLIGVANLHRVDPITESDQKATFLTRESTLGSTLSIEVYADRPMMFCPCCGRRY